MQAIADFVHLHVHTEYSLLDGMIRIQDLVSRAAQFQMPAVAMTDHGVMFGAVRFYEEAKKQGLNPIIGCEVYVASGSRLERDKGSYHLTLLCKNRKGYKNLCRLVSAGYLEGYYYKPRVDMELLAEHNEGLIALSGCLKGKIASLLLADKRKEAEKTAGLFKDIFGDRFYLELMDNGIEDQIRVNRELIALGKKLALPVVATNDCHYLTREMAKAHEVLLCIQTGKCLTDEKRMKLATDEFYFRSPGEMKEKFAEVPEAIANTIEIANRCALEWDFSKKHFPPFPLPEDLTLEEALEQAVKQGFEQRRAKFLATDPRFKEREKQYRERLKYELEVITKMGFSGYFLIVADFVNWAKKRGIPVGPGRGSAAGSLVSYCLGITDLNPMRYGLIFERFLNPERRQLPDIDVDFCMERREEVLQYVTEKYGGADHVAQIITFGTMKARAAVRDVGRVLEIPLPEVDRIAKLIPSRLNITIEEALQEEPRLQEMKEKDSKVRELLELAQNLEGIARHASTHAAGVVISDKPLVEYVPLYKDPKKQTVVVQFDKKSVENAGLIKFDLLGLETLTLLRHCTAAVKRNHGVEIDLERLPLDDEKTYALLSSGDTGGVFQLESSGMKDILRRLHPNRFEDLIAVVALYRPGALEVGGHDRYIERKHGREKVEYLLPELKEILEETYGVLVYQEQVMEIAVKLAGYTMGEADTLRKAIGGKNKDIMEEEKQKFITRAIEKGIEENKAREIAKEMAAFALYGFNKSHAAAYALVAFQTAYMKAHYPVEFMASLLTIEISNENKLMRYLKECEEKEIPVDPPHVNRSFWEFHAEKGRILFGLGAIKGVGKSAVEAVVEAREEGGPFTSLFDFCQRVDLKRMNKRTLECLIKAGAFDGLAQHRAQLIAALDSALEMAHKVQEEQERGQGSLFEVLGEKNADSQEPAYPEVDPWSSTELLGFEKEVFGFYLTGHPLARFEQAMKMFGVVETSKVPFLANGQEVYVGGMITERKNHISKKGERMAFITVSDLHGSLEVVVFPGVYAESAEYLEDEENPVLIKGRVEINEDKAKLMAGEIFPLHQAKDRIPLTIHLTLTRPESSLEDVQALKHLILAHKGKAKVVVHVKKPERFEAVIALPSDFRADPNHELMAELKDRFGEQAIRFEAA